MKTQPTHEESWVGATEECEWGTRMGGTSSAYIASQILFMSTVSPESLTANFGWSYARKTDSQQRFPDLRVDVGLRQKCHSSWGRDCVFHWSQERNCVQFQLLMSFGGKFEDWTRPDPEDTNSGIGKENLNDLNSQTGGRGQCQSGWHNQCGHWQTKHPATNQSTNKKTINC